MLGDKWCGQHRVWHFMQRLIIVISCHRWQAFITRPSTLGMSDPKMSTMPMTTMSISEEKEGFDYQGTKKIELN